MGDLEALKLELAECMEQLKKRNKLHERKAENYRKEWEAVKETMMKMKAENVEKLEVECAQQLAAQERDLEAEYQQWLQVLNEKVQQKIMDEFHEYKKKVDDRLAYLQSIEQEQFALYKQKEAEVNMLVDNVRKAKKLRENAPVADDREEIERLKRETGKIKMATEKFLRAFGSRSREIHNMIGTLCEGMAQLKEAYESLNTENASVGLSRTF